MKDADADQVRALYTRAMDGWNRGGGGFRAPLPPTANFIAFDGQVRGREDLGRAHDPLFRTHLKGTRLGDVTDVRFLADNVALIHASGSTILRGKTLPRRDSVQTLVAIRRDGRWRSTPSKTRECSRSGRACLARCCGSSPIACGDGASQERPPVAGGTLICPLASRPHCCGCSSSISVSHMAPSFTNTG